MKIQSVYFVKSKEKILVPSWVYPTVGRAKRIAVRLQESFGLPALVIFKLRSKPAKRKPTRQ